MSAPRMRRSIVDLSIVAATALGLAACGPQQSAGTQTASSTASPAPVLTAAADGGGTARADNAAPTNVPNSAPPRIGQPVPPLSNNDAGPAAGAPAPATATPVPAPPPARPIAERAPQAAPSAHLGRVSQIEAIRERPPGTGKGAVVGGVLGALVGNQFGHGSGKAAMTVVGAAGGAVAGNNVERNINKRVVGYRVTVRLDNGKLRTYEKPRLDGLQVGDRVRIDGQRLRRA
jgi:outer membrane lipoprotein SlyB